MMKQTVHATKDDAIDTHDRRPGVPAERRPAPAGNAHWTVPDRQPDDGRALRDASRPMTATFGTSLPPRGLSGAIRRAAYRIPDYYARRWFLLVIADRVDTVESAALRAAARPTTWLAAAGLLATWAALRPRRRPTMRSRLAHALGH
jgi:hypothetical protein